MTHDVPPELTSAVNQTVLTHLAGLLMTGRVPSRGEVIFRRSGAYAR